jgi:rRNA maturation RNase YbeY
MILFFTQDTHFKLKGKRIYKKWLSEITQQKGQKLKNLNIVYCSDRYILDLNRRFLGHDFFTDVITFDTLLPNDWPIKGCPGEVSGDIFISIECVQANAKRYKVSFSKELERVMIHGLLHLLGYKDTKPEERKIMKREEDTALLILESQS